MYLRNPMPDHPRRREDVAAIQDMLRRLGYRVETGPMAAPAFSELVVDGIFGADTEAVVMAFQEDEGVMADGIVGPQTMATIEESFARREIELSSPGADSIVMGERDEPDQPLGPRLERFHLQRVEADAYEEGYTRIGLRQDVAGAFAEVRRIVNDHGGIITSSGGIRSLTANVSSNRSATSMHYVGRAFDLFIYAGMVDPAKDPYVVAKTDTERRWRVYARCRKKGKLAKDMTVERVVSYQRREGELTVKGRFLDLTALLDEHGFKPISARRNFERGGSMMGAEWWHFQSETGLVRRVSTFGSELLRLYTPSTLERTPPWRYRDRVFGVSWF